MEHTTAARVAGSIRGSAKKQHTCRVGCSGGILVGKYGVGKFTRQSGDGKLGVV